MMGLTNKTDKLDAQGLNRLQRNGTLPTVWIPPGPLRDLRELTRTRLVLVAQRTRLKNRLSATLAKYGTPASECSDPYGKRGRAELDQHLERLPEQTRWVSGQLLLQLDFVSAQVKPLEQRLAELVQVTPENAVAADDAGSGRNSGGDDRVGDRRGGAIPKRHAPGQLLGNDTARARQRRESALWIAARGREPVFEMGLCRSGQFGGGESPALPGAACQPVIPAAAPKERASQSDWSGGAASGRSRLPRAARQTDVSRSQFWSRSDQPGVSAILS